MFCSARGLDASVTSPQKPFRQDELTARVGKVLDFSPGAMKPRLVNCLDSPFGRCQFITQNSGFRNSKIRVSPIGYGNFIYYV